ncbi:hypothetical protein CYMTET_27694, partial [Cymbomonas tetramitiformis]
MEVQIPKSRNACFTRLRRKFAGHRGCRSDKKYIRLVLSGIYLKAMVFALQMWGSHIFSASLVILLMFLNPVASQVFSSGPKLSELSLLLPPPTGSAVRLHGYKGCFRWVVQNAGLLKVVPEHLEDTECSTSALISPVGSYEGRRSTYVTATDIETGIALRCEVFVDKVVSLQIIQNTRRLYLDSLATVELKGFDIEGNAFSTLDGLEFSWDVHTVSGKSTVFDSLLGHSAPCVPVPMDDTWRTAL